MDDNFSTSQLDPITLDSMMQALPEIQARQRRVQQMQQIQQQFAQQQQQAQSQPAQNYQPRQMGGLYPTVSHFQPDRAQDSSALIGQIGQIMAQRQGSNLADQNDQSRNGQMIRAIQQASGGGGNAGGGVPGGDVAPDQLSQKPTSATLRAYMAMLSGADPKDIIGQIPHVASTKVGSNGHIINVMSNGDMRDTGVEADYKTKIQAAANGDVMYIPTTGAHRGEAQPVTMGNQGGGPAAAQAGSVGTQSAPPTGFMANDAAVAQREGGLNPNDAGRGASNFGINQAAHPEVDVTKLTPDQAQQIRKTYWDQIGGDDLPPAIQSAAYDTAINMGVDKAKQLIQASGGDPQAFRQARKDAYVDMYANDKDNRFTKADFNSWMQRNDATTQGSSGPATATTVSGPNGTAASVTGPQGNTGGVLRVQTAGEKARDAAQAKQDVELAGAPQLAAAKAAGEAQADQAKKKADLKLAVAQQNTNTEKLLDQIQRLKNDPNLDKILSGSVLGGLKDDDLDSRVGTMYKSLNPGAAQADALYHQVRSNAALQGLQQFRGLGMRITQGEFNVDAKGQTMLNRQLSKQEFLAELDRLAKHVQDANKVVNDNANSPTWRPDVRATTEAAAPAASMSDDDLLKKYGGM